MLEVLILPEESAPQRLERCAHGSEIFDIGCLRAFCGSQYFNEVHRQATMVALAADAGAVGAAAGLEATAKAASAS
jgi:hypothetical protein